MISVWGASGGAHGARGAGGAGGAASGLGPVPEPQTLQECEDLFEEHQTEWVTSGAIPPARTTTAPSPPAPPAAAGGEVRGAPPIVGVSRAGDAAEGGVVPAAGGVPSVDKASGVAVAGEGRAGGGGQPPRETMSLEARLLDYYSVANASKPADEIQRCASCRMPTLKKGGGLDVTLVQNTSIIGAVSFGGWRQGGGCGVSE